jgi:hypothetical protein
VKYNNEKVLVQHLLNGQNSFSSPHPC